ncbi:MAG: membrane protein insertion efficiency factor YidD [Vitreoscilla sp.]
MTLARSLLLAAIRGYKRHVSPRKGFGCAYRIELDACSCSTLGLRAVSRYGAWRGLGVLRLRLQQCRLVAEERRARPFIAQAGFIDCDVPCDGSCDVSPCAGCEACELAACIGDDWGDCDCCGWPWSSRETVATVRRRRRRGDPYLTEPGRGGPPPEA